MTGVPPGTESWAVVPPVPTVLGVEGSERLFAVRRVFCVGRNYAAHAREMGHDTREPPFFFAKDADCVLAAPCALPYPPMTAELHHEVELAVCLGGGGASIAADDALDLVFGYAVALDMTRRDLQAEAKRMGRPWDMAKAFDGSAVIGRVTPRAGIGHPAQGAIALAVNGVPRQRGDLAQQIWSVPEILARLSAYVRLRPGDVVMTGTPEGVGAVGRGDVIEAMIDGLVPIEVRVT